MPSPVSANGIFSFGASEKSTFWVLTGAPLKLMNCSFSVPFCGVVLMFSIVPLIAGYPPPVAN